MSLSLTNPMDNSYTEDQQSRMRLLDVSSKRLYGRDAELQLLNDLQKKVQSKGEQRKIVWIHGNSGCGKTTLARAALAEADATVQEEEQQQTFFLEGKYNQLYSSTSAPYSAIIEALETLGKMSLSAGYEAEMKESLKFEGTFLTKLIPSFRDFLTLDEEAVINSVNTAIGLDSSSLMLASERLTVAFRSFLRNFTTKVRPLTIFLDDLQWSDRYSQELIASIAHDDELHNFLLVGAFRNEHPELIRGFLTDIKDLASTSVVTDMPLHNLDLDSVNDLLACILSLEADKALPLAQVVHRKTDGNPYFVKQLLVQLHAQNFLTYNFSSLQWAFDVDGADAGTDVSDNVVDVVTRRIQGIPARVQRVLKFAACLGFYFDIDILRKLYLHVGCLDLTETEQIMAQSSGEGTHQQDKTQKMFDSGSPDTANEILKANMETQMFEAALKRAEEEAFLERAGSVMKFSHDRIQQVVYDMIESGSARDILHHQIGQYLKKCHELSNHANESRQLLFLAVDQLNRGSNLIDNDEGRLSLIQLNYETSKVAKQQGGTQAVASFLRKALEMVRPSFWLYHYEIILEVYNSSAEVDFSLGMLEEAKAAMEATMKNAVRDVDKVRALCVEFQILGSQCQYKEAIELSCRVLRLLGEPVPKKVSLLHVAMEYFKARKESKNKPNEFFTNLPQTESTNVITILRILRVGSVYGWNGDINFAGFAMLRGFRITIREGASNSTPFLYSGYGFMLGLFGEYNEAFRFGQLALNTQKGKETFPSAVNLTYGNLTHLQLPLGVALEPFLKAYRVGLETGDLFHGTICLACYALVHVTCGLPLAPFADDMHNFGDQLKVCHQDLPLAWLLPTHQLALNLMGKSVNPIDLSREAIIRHHKGVFSENLLTCDEATHMVPADILYTWYLQLYNAYILEDVVMADKTLKRILNLKKVARRFGGTHMMNYFLPFMDGLVGLWLSKKTPKMKTGPRVAKAAIKELTKISKTRPVNSKTLLNLLLVEAAARKKSRPPEEVRKTYNKVISDFCRSGLNHFAAITYELAGKYMLENEDNYWAEYYLGEALRRWDEYDAVVKVQLMAKEHEFLQPIAEELSNSSVKSARKSGSFIQGRARFDIMMDSASSLQPRRQSSIHGQEEGFAFPRFG